MPRYVSKSAQWLEFCNLLTEAEYWAVRTACQTIQDAGHSQQIQDVSYVYRMLATLPCRPPSLE